MPALSSSHPSDWENSVYIIWTTRVLVVIGATYLVRTMYQGLQLWRTARGIGVIQEASGAALDAILPNALDDMTADTDDGPNFEIAVAPTLRPPPRRYDPHGRSSSPRFRYEERIHGSDEEVLSLSQGTRGVHAQSGGRTIGNIEMVVHDDAGLPPPRRDQSNPTV